MVRGSFADSQVRSIGKAQTGEGELTALESWKSGGYQSEERCWPGDLAHSSLVAQTLLWKGGGTGPTALQAEDRPGLRKETQVERASQLCALAVLIRTPGSWPPLDADLWRGVGVKEAVGLPFSL